MSKFPLSLSRQVVNTFYISGQIGQKDGKLVSSEIAEQTRQAIENIKNILKDSGLELSNVADVTAFLIDYSDYDAFNEAYRNGFQEPFPTRTTVFVKSLPLDARVELKAVAFR